MGLQARLIADTLSAAGWAEFLRAGVVVTLTIIAARFAWVYAGTYLPRLVPMIRRREPTPDRRIAFMVSFTGLRGVVSLAAALSIPTMIGARPLADRDLVLFVTFFTVLITLLGLGSVLRWVARLIRLDAAGRDEAVKAKRDERAARLKGIRAVLKELEVAEGEGQPAVPVAALRCPETRQIGAPAWVPNLAGAPFSFLKTAPHTKRHSNRHRAVRNFWRRRAVTRNPGS